MSSSLKRPFQVSPKKKKQMPRTPGANDAYRRVIEEEDHIYLTLVCKDGAEILVPDYIAFHSGYALLSLSLPSQYSNTPRDADL